MSDHPALVGVGSTLVSRKDADLYRRQQRALKAAQGRLDQLNAEAVMGFRQEELAMVTQAVVNAYLKDMGRGD